jgi:poly(beta-D-mannuronate) lyase
LLIRAKGTEEAPIVISANSPGGAEITGPAGFRISDASYVIIQGFKFTHSQDNSGSSDDMAIQCENCKNVRFTRNYFSLTTNTNEMSDWLGITSMESTNNRIDHNTFENKATVGVFVLILGSNDDVSHHNRIDHNYFHNQLNSGGNGGECLRVGNSVVASKNAYTTVEYNLFEKCNGDMESVTVKSSSNIIRYNTFRDNHGSLTLRHGNNNTVDGNFFLYGENGIRIYGHDHKIINNYFEGNYGADSLSTLVVGSGTVEEDLNYSNDEHSQPQNIVVAFNTFVKNKSNIVFGENSRPLHPLKTTVSNNIIWGDFGALVDYKGGQDTVWEDNILWGLADKGSLPNTGYTSTDPIMELGSEGLYRPVNNSPAIDKADPDAFPYVTRDIDGQSRSGMKDIGADEFSTDSAVVYPLITYDAGPDSK